ncbi:hypothetical protein SAMN02799630_00163 [Paenibacillus sp. UNCCL117]|uniref:TIGR01777 family oxidoreductase n=1 Tax=unclassified Paenibacillus TaxID=185978 RepID=UPI00088D07BC|nr:MULTISPECIES: TIGR01777 family oxidoreductase [unclassified Paenibacillus]SDC50272.1 hypothetical protein SAMN04488602_102369 [Paenibacillus sp. cl123]SFW11623.1 hypothetical protein SAMN02799630_00163 [Paenibacillus sp. UNCCL117]
MKVVITGGTGFIGKHLIDYYIAQKASLLVVTRKKQKSSHPLMRYVTWDELEAGAKLLDGVDAIVNLAGETINQRWTEDAKKRIMQSRLDAVARVSSWIENMEKKPVLINASAVGIYGMSETESFIEESEWRKDDFLANVVDEWEAAAEQIPDTRVVLLRLGVVLGKDGGAFPKMIAPFKFGFGGRIGSGTQYMSWIHIDDLCRLIDFCIADGELEGPVNATAPVSISNDEFSRRVAARLGRPNFFPVPAFLIKLMFGEMSQLLLKGQRVLPKAALDRNFHFNYPVMELALMDLLPDGKQGGK